MYKPLPAAAQPLGAPPEGGTLRLQISVVLQTTQASNNAKLINSNSIETIVSITDKFF